MSMHHTGLSKPEGTVDFLLATVDSSLLKLLKLLDSFRVVLGDPLTGLPLQENCLLPLNPHIPGNSRFPDGFGVFASVNCLFKNSSGEFLRRTPSVHLLPKTLQHSSIKHFIYDSRGDAAQA